MGDTIKYTLELSREQNEQLNGFQNALGARTKAEVIRKALGLAALMSEVANKGQRLGVVDKDNKVVELIRLL